MKLRWKRSSGLKGERRKEKGRKEGFWAKGRKEKWRRQRKEEGRKGGREEKGKGLIWN